MVYNSLNHQTGLSGKRTAKISEMHQSLVDMANHRALPCFAWSLADEYGQLATGSWRPGACNETIDPQNSIYKVYSLTKPILALTVLVLCEAKRLDLSSKIIDYVPELFQGQTSIGSCSSSIRNLLCQTGGIGGGSVMTPEDTAQYANAGVRKFTHGEYSLTEEPEAFLEKLCVTMKGKAPMRRWEYGRGYDVLGIIVARITGKSLEQVVREAVLEPLQMQSTSFTLPGTSMSKLQWSESRPSFRTENEDYLPCFPSGGSGLFSTVDDYQKFCGYLSVRRSPGKTPASDDAVTMMLADQIGDLRGTGPDYIPGQYFSYGFGVGVRDWKQRAMYGCDYFWLGRAGTNFQIAKDAKVSLVFFTEKYGVARKINDTCQNSFVNLVSGW